MSLRTRAPSASICHLPPRRLVPEWHGSERADCRTGEAERIVVRVLRVYHAGRDPGHRLRDRALQRAGSEVVLLLPSTWPDGGSQRELTDEPFEVIELPVVRAGDVNRHRYRDVSELREVLNRVQPDLLDLHEEPFSSVCRQWLRAADRLPVVAYTAQNVDKRLPPPFAQYEQKAFRRLRGLYPCSRQAASVARGKGFAGPVCVLPLGVDTGLLTPGQQRLDDPELVLGLVGRLVSEKGVLDAVRVLAAVHRQRPARLLVVGEGPLAAEVRAEAALLDVADRVELLTWQPPPAMAALYRRMHLVLVPSRATQRWVEQFGRVAVEAQACGAVVAGYRSGALPEAAGDAAVLVAEGDAAALEGAVRRLIEDLADFKRRRSAGITRAQQLGWDEIAAAQLSLYERALAHQPQRPRPRPSRSQARRRAVTEFGPTAVLAGGAQRPFALPVLRRESGWTQALGRALDVVLR